MAYYNPHQTNDLGGGIVVYLREGESVDSLVKRFKKRVSKSGILLDLKEKMFYESKGERRRRKQEASRRKQQKEVSSEENNNEA